MEQITCPHCQSIIGVQHATSIHRDKDSMDCPVCAKVLLEWNEAGWYHSATVIIDAIKERQTMSSPLPIQQRADGKWNVLTDGEPIVAQTREDADVLADIPVVHEYRHKDQVTQAERARAEQVHALCRAYSLAQQMKAVRDIGAWLKHQP